MTLSVQVGAREVELRLGPLGGGDAGKLMANTDAGIGPVVEKLTDERRIASEGAFEMLELTMRDKR
jgi:hypothetical protein